MVIRPRHRNLTLVAASTLVLAISVGIASAVVGIRYPDQGTPVPEADLQPVPELSAFRTPEDAEDRALSHETSVIEAIRALTSEDAGAPESWRPGRQDEDSLRVLMTNLGTKNRTVFAFRTDKSRLCMGLTQFTSGCFQGLPARLPITVTAGDPDEEMSEEGPIIWGYASDNVEAVIVKIAGVEYRARLANNAYFFQVPNSSSSLSAVEAVQARLSDGTAYEAPVSMPVRPELVTTDRSSGRGVHQPSLDFGHDFLPPQN